MEFSCRCHSTTGGITSSTLLPFGLWAPGSIQVHVRARNRYSVSYEAGQVRDCMKLFHDPDIRKYRMRYEHGKGSFPRVGGNEATSGVTVKFHCS